MRIKQFILAVLMLTCVMSYGITAGATQATYDHIVDMSENVFVYLKDGKYGFMDANGEMLTAAIYDSYSDFEDGCAIVVKDGLYGVVNTSGTEIISAIYEDITYMGDMSDSDSSYYSYYFRVYIQKYRGVIAATFDLSGNIITDFTDDDELLKERYIVGEPYTNTIYIKDESGNTLGTYLMDIYEGAPSYQEGYCAVQNMSGKQGVVDMNCNTVISFIYDKTYDVNDGLSRVKLDGKYGFVNTNNEVVIPIIYDDASDFGDGIAYVKYGDNYGFVNTSGEVVIDFIYDSVSEISNMTVYDNTVFVVSSGGKYGIVTSKNLQVTDTIYDSAMVSAKENIIQVHKWVENKHAFINLETGEQISDFVYANLYDGDYTLYWSSEGIIATCLGFDQYGYLSANGDVILPFEYGFTYAFENGYGKVRLTSNVNDSTYGYVDTNGNIVIPFEYSSEEAVYALYEYIFSGSTTTSTPTDTTPTVTPTSNLAVPSTATVLLDGKEISFDAYEIENNNYFKLRDIAYALCGTDVCINVMWHIELEAILILTNSTYYEVGGELELGDGTAQSYKLSTAPLYLDFEEISLTAYEINGYNYFKLRDLGELLDFNVSWDNDAQSIIIASDESYTAD